MDGKVQWNSYFSFLLTMIGSAVGLGNIWRFSYVLYSNGGGSFFIPYLFAIIVIGIPFLILEYGIGFTFKDSFANVLKSINPKFEFIGWMVVLLCFFILIYYMIIIAWDMVYLLNSFTFAWGENTSNYFINNVGGSDNLINMWTVIIPTVINVVILWFVLWFISHKNIECIGNVSKVLIPSLFIIMIVITIYAFTLPGHMIGVNALIRPKWHALLDIKIWLAACGQIVFSLSMGQAISLTYASYLPEKTKLTDSVLYVVVSNSLFEIFTAFGVFSILGYMSLHTGTVISKIVTEGTTLVFVVFPMIFNIMGPVGRILAPLLFLAILFAGITSALALFESILCSLTLKFDLSRKRTTTILCIIGCLSSFLFTTKIGSYLVEIVDSFINQFCILFLIGLQCIIFTWIHNIELILVINEYGSIKIGKKWKFLVKYIIPIILFVMWVIGIIDLFIKVTFHKLIIDITIIILVIGLSFILTKINIKK